MTGPRHLELHLPIDEAIRLESALAAFDRLTAGAGPDRYELEAAPLLSDWRRSLMPSVEPVLIGAVEGHPRLSGRRHVATSRLLALDPQAGWARTLNRWYRLGPAAD
ncbi:DUF6634 family protein [Methylobacterium planeticum]|uniref:Uncharacterized protein n=1 Tax=Methylobacterium planeticum TaxID=2615211 RepID=A0A6N6MGN1_9HYPH|nr:DUF6634 family protein [Methylobacterium planeticum]KAB1070033.1 hypothetical protein F6X51_23965 [Methylobacterium planeticum]